MPGYLGSSVMQFIKICVAALPFVGATQTFAQEVKVSVTPTQVPLPHLAEASIPVAGPITVDAATNNVPAVMESVLRVMCPSRDSGGTGFVHKSGRVITAAHVVAGCDAKGIVLILANGKQVAVKSVVADQKLDLALLEPTEPLRSKLEISKRSGLKLGAMVSTWGFPAGYLGSNPLLSVGYLSGATLVPPRPDGSPRFIVNAAFNGGNSGGPLLLVEDGTVVGVVTAKLAPLPEFIESALKALATSRSGVVYTRSLANGTTEQLVESQVLELILQYLRSQTQLVVGFAVREGELRNFLTSHKIEP